MSVKITLVASSNGLGHARRLLQLSTGFLERGIQTCLIITQSQSKKLQFEIAGLEIFRKLELHLIAPTGLEVFASKKTTIRRPIETSTVELLASSDFTISDNSLWPAEFSKKFYLFGHFDWVTYFTKNKNEKNTLLDFEEVYQKEKELLREVSGWFKMKDFHIESQRKIKSVEIPILKYHRDPKKYKSRTNQMWLSFGTTGRNVPKLDESLNQMYQSQQLESWRMDYKNRVPEVIVGRPGIGTIRDCFANNVIFVPLWNGVDFELEHNAEVVMKLGLSINFKNLISGGVSENALNNIRSDIDSYWNQSSAMPFSVVGQVLENL